MAVAVLLLAAGWLVSAPVPKALKKRLDYYPCTEGTRWVYTSEPANAVEDDQQTREVETSSEKDGVVDFTIHWKSGGGVNVWVMRKDSTGVYWLKDDNRTHDPPHLIVKPKLVEGDEWTNDFKAGARFLYTQTRTVGKAETVKTPAGNFLAVPIRSKQLNSTTTFWYCDGVGLVKIQQDGSVDTVLKSYRIGDGK